MKRALRLGRQAPDEMTPGQVTFLSGLADDDAQERIVERATAHRASRMKQRHWDKFRKGE